MGEPAQGVDNVGLCSVMCYLLYLKHDDALAQQLCGFVSCSSQGSYWPNVNVMVPDTVRRVTCAWPLAEPLSMWGGALSPVPVLVEDGSMCVCVCVCVCVLKEVRGLCTRCVYACLNCWPFWTEHLLCGTYCLTPHCWQSHFVIPDTVSTVMWVTVGGATWEHWGWPERVLCWRCVHSVHALSLSSFNWLWEGTPHIHWLFQTGFLLWRIGVEVTILFGEYMFVPRMQSVCSNEYAVSCSCVL